MGTKKFKRRPERLLQWTLGSKRRKFNYGKSRSNATTGMNIEAGVRPHVCEMCGAKDATWRKSVVCLCDKCYKDLLNKIQY